MTVAAISPSETSPLLLIDCSGERCHAAIGAADAVGWEHLESLEAPAVEGLHEVCQQVLQRAGLRALDVGGIVACDGPGGTIGLRITKTLVDVLQMLSAPRQLPLFTYDSLAGAILTNSGQAGSIICAGRRGHWFYRDCQGRCNEPPIHFPDSTPPPAMAHPLVQLRQRFGREPLYPGAQLIEPGPPPPPSTLVTSGYLRTCKTFLPFDPQAPEYVRWSGARHE